MERLARSGAGHDPSADAARLRDHGRRVERLLEELRRNAGPPVFARVEELVHCLVDVYGAGLERTLSHALKAGAASPTFQNLLSDDELVSSLLLLHGLHPHSTEARVRKALQDVQPYLRSHAGGVELLEIQPQGTVK